MLTQQNMATTWFSAYCSHPVGARVLYYPTLLWGIVRTTINPHAHWYDRIDEKVVLGALPIHSVVEKLMAKEQIRAVVTCNEPYETRLISPSKKGWAELGVIPCYIPTVDYNNAPTLPQIRKAMDFISNIKDGTSVYVHCKAGRSRSATVVVCYLIRKYGLNPDDALLFVEEKRPNVVLGSAHKERVEEFYKMYTQK